MLTQSPTVLPRPWGFSLPRRALWICRFVVDTSQCVFSATAGPLRALQTLGSIFGAPGPGACSLSNQPVAGKWEASKLHSISMRAVPMIPTPQRTPTMFSVAMGAGLGAQSGGVGAPFRVRCQVDGARIGVAVLYPDNLRPAQACAPQGPSTFGSMMTSSLLPTARQADPHPRHGCRLHQGGDCCTHVDTPMRLASYSTPHDPLSARLWSKAAKPAHSHWMGLDP